MGWTLHCKGFSLTQWRACKTTEKQTESFLEPVWFFTLHDVQVNEPLEVLSVVADRTPVSPRVRHPGVLHSQREISAVKAGLVSFCPLISEAAPEFQTTLLTPPHRPLSTVSKREMQQWSHYWSPGFKHFLMFNRLHHKHIPNIFILLFNFFKLFWRIMNILFLFLVLQFNFVHSERVAAAS